MAIKRITTYLHGSKDHNGDLQAKYDLDFANEDAEVMFAYAFYEVKIDADIDLETGKETIVAVNEKRLENANVASNSNGDVELRSKVSEIVRWNSWTLSNEEAAKALMELIQTERTQAAAEAIEKTEKSDLKYILQHLPPVVNGRELSLVIDRQDHYWYAGHPDESGDFSIGLYASDVDPEGAALSLLSQYDRAQANPEQPKEQKDV